MVIFGFTFPTATLTLPVNDGLVSEPTIHEEKPTPIKEILQRVRRYPPRKFFDEYFFNVYFLFISILFCLGVF